MHWSGDTSNQSCRVSHTPRHSPPGRHGIPAEGVQLLLHAPPRRVRAGRQLLLQQAHLDLQRVLRLLVLLRRVACLQRERQRSGNSL